MSQQGLSKADKLALQYEKNDPPIAELRKTVNERMMKGIPDTTWIDLAAAIPQSGTE